jgi:hypothetical protein
MKGIVDPDEPGGRFQLLMKGGLEIGDRKAGFRYVANLMDAVIKKITQVLETTPKLDGKDDIRWTILGYASSVLFSEDDSKKKESFYHSPADRLRLLVKILQDLEDPKKGLQSSDIHKIIRSGILMVLRLYDNYPN